MGFLTDIPVGFPGYTGRIPPSAATLPRILRDNGYSSFAVGKWHLAPRWDQSASGPFTHWPLGLGFERYYGFLAGDTNQWTPDLVSDNGFVEPPARPEDGYHLTEDLVDRARRLILDQRHATPGKPFFLYFATGAMHAPHHAPREWIDRYRGAFDDGWEAWRAQTFGRQVDLGIVPEGTVLPERPPWVQEWSSLSGDEQRLFARMMEVFAGFLSHTDAQIGRLLSFLEEIDALDDTLVLLISDNGTSAEGGPIGTFNEHRFTHDQQDDIGETLELIDELGGFRSYPHYPWGWAWAGNTPLRLWKRYTWLGGVRTPLVAHWPRGIADAGAIRPQFCHAVDLLPTICDAVGIDVPERVDGVEQLDLDGASILPTFTDADAPDARATQYFEMLGSRAIYHDGWKATTDHIGKQLTVEQEALVGSHDFADDHWALFDLRNDFSEATDVADEHPDRVARMEALWWAEAGRNQVLPMEDSFLGRAVAIEPSPNLPRHRTTFRPGAGGIAEDLLPPMGAGFVLRADVTVGPDAGPEAHGREAHGIVCALGDWVNGWAWYLLDGRPVTAFNLFGHVTRVAGSAPLAAGDHELGLTYEGGRLTLLLDDAVVGSDVLPGHLPFRWQIGGGQLLIGRDTGFPVCDDYEPPFAFSGELRTVTVEIPMFAPRNPTEEVATALRSE
jgi:arylsulfatase